MAPKYRMLLLFAIAMVVTYLVYWPILRIAKEKNIVDNPDARKLQRIPIPVLGGAAVFFGIVVGLCFFKTMLSFTCLFAVLTAMIVMLYVGIIDDIDNLPPLVRLLIEITVMTLLIYGTHYAMCNFQGLWGIGLLPTIISVPFSVFVMVGIINAINMIDGVDGMVSAYCIMACSLFGVVFFLEHEYSMAALAAVSVGALIPFFVHNVFGKESKMFIGDGGSMMMGTVLSAMAIALCKYRINDYHFLVNEQFGVLSFTLAVLSVPIFDTLRVMSFRMAHGHSPFHPDKNHLHHIFIELGFSHLATTVSELTLNLFVVAVWVLAWRLGAPVDIQMYSVIAASLLVTFGLASFLKFNIRRKTKFCSILRSLGNASHLEGKESWTRLQKFLDGGRGAALLLTLLLLVAPLSSCNADNWDRHNKKSHAIDTTATCIAIFGDLQNYTQDDANAEYYNNTLQWLKERQKKHHDIACILHTGDITNNNAGHQWRRFKSSTEIVSGIIPFYTSTGNHDYEAGPDAKIIDRRSTNLMNYYDFPLSFERVVAQYEDHRLENAVYRNYIDGERVDVMMLEFSPRYDVVKWAMAYLKEHSDTKHILVVHEFLGRGGVIIENDNYADKCFGDTGLSACKPKEIWSNIIAPYDNILCVLCGHVCEFIIYNELKNEAGRNVPVIMFNLESKPNGGDGWVMLWEVEHGSDDIAIKFYNTVRHEYFAGEDGYRKFKFR